MNRKFIATTLVLLATFFALPLATAADVPLLTWERGKEQSVVLGGESANNAWQILLIQDNRVISKFRASKANSEGFIVYSTSLPSDLPLGSYTIETQAKNSARSIVAGVNVVKLAYFTIAQIPRALIFLLIALAFVTTTISTLRARRYKYFSYLESLEFTEDREDAMRSIPRILRGVYKRRRDSLASITPSLFRFNLESSGQLLHKISPASWAGLPLAAAALGAFVADQTQADGGIPNTPMYLLAIGSLIGVIDAYCGIVLLGSFAFFQVITGNVTSIRDFVAVLAVGLGWFAPVLIANLYLIIGERDLSKFLSGSSRRVFHLLNCVIAGFLGAIALTASQVLTDSVSVKVTQNGSQALYVAIFVGCAIALRSSLEPIVDRYRQFRPGHQILEVLTFNLQRALAPASIIAIYGFASFVIYVWTSSLAISALSAFVITLPFIFLNIHFSKILISSLMRIPRSALLESLIVATITFGIFLYIQTLPYEISQRSRALLLFGSLPALVHAIYSAFHNYAETREAVEA